jgi:hypothetical protein
VEARQGFADIVREATVRLARKAGKMKHLLKP